jgi:hypothetical protein
MKCENKNCNTEVSEDKAQVFAGVKLCDVCYQKVKKSIGL